MNTEDLVPVPRGLLGAARYAIKNKVDAPEVYAQLGDYAYQGREHEQAGLDAQHLIDEQLSTLQADRGIKAANLKTLVDMVLAIEVNSQDNFDPYTVRDAIALAQGLKQ
jgi:hypothetical protein